MALSGHVARSHKCPLLGGKAVVLRRGRRCRDGWKPPHIHICSVGRRELGVWDLSHSLSGTSLVGLSITEIPLNYGIFCSTYDFVVARSEERRVGKECRSRWSPQEYNKKQKNVDYKGNKM